MADTTIPADVAKLGFEDALKELEEIVRALEQGKGKLEDAIKSYERGAALKAHCERKLAEAQARIEKIALGADGTPKAEPARLD
ncbi:MAG: exodeoxyribonuclease VII small subunit [Alphaproteobacteria bacterium]|nr:exodeoxyribonuclease VII small subunit [Alphaproteobacteria bacterium]